MFRARRAVAGEGDHDDVGFDAPQRLVAEPHPLHHPGGEVLADDVALCDQIHRHRYGLGLLEVERHAQLALIVLVEVAAAIGTARRTVGKGRQ